MIPFVLAFGVITQMPMRVSAASRTDSIVVSRLSKESPHTVPMVKSRSLGPGGFLAAISGRLQTSGFFELTAEAIANACGNPGATVNRLAVRVHGDTGWRELVIPDGCQPASHDLSEQLSTLRDIAWDALAGHVRKTGETRIGP